jgi:hypothetical protein
MAAVLMGSECHAATRWEPIGPEGGTGVALAFDAAGAQTLYAGLEEGGVWRSADGGATWSAAQGGLPPGTIQTLAADPQSAGTLYVGRRDDGIWRSADGGRSWTQAAASLGGLVADVRILRFDPTSHALWAGLAPKVGQASLFRSGDGGDSWAPVDLGAAGLPVTALALGAGDVFAGTSGRGVFRGSTTGDSWVSVLASTSVSSLAWGGGRLYAATDSGLSVTRDRGATWDLLIAPPESIPSRPPNRFSLGEIALSPDDPDLLYIAFHLQLGLLPPVSGLYRSRDGGVTHDAVGGGFPSLQPRALLFDPAVRGRILAAPGPLGVWSSADGVSGWRSGNRGLRAAPVSKVLADPKRPGVLYAGGTSQGLVRTLDGGASWLPVNGGGAIDDPQALDPDQPATLYAFGNIATGRALFKSRNGGRSWALLLGAPTLSFTLDPRHPKTLFAGGSGGFSNPVLRSDDGGASWTQGIVSCTFPFHLAVAPTGEVYAGGSSWCGILGTAFGGVDRSDDGGKTFLNRRDGLPPILPVPFSLVVDPRRPATLYGGFQGLFQREAGLEGANRLFRSRDRADHWEAVAGPDMPVLDISFPPSGPNTIWIASSGQGTWRSGDAGETFRPVGVPGLPTRIVFDLEFDRRSPATLYAATPGGLFRLASD